MSIISSLQIIVSGVTTGLIYALNAASFSLIYGQANILFFALGAIYMLGAVSSYLFVVLAGMPYFLALVVVVLGLGLFGIVLERFLFRQLRGSVLTFVFATIALDMLLTGVALETFGRTSVSVPTPLSGSISLCGAFLPLHKLLVVVVSLAIILALHFFFQRTRAGRAIRAVSQDMDAAKLVGIDVNRINALVFFLALATAGVAGALVAPLYYVDVFMGPPVLTTVLIVVVLGGLGSFQGAIVGGLFIGLLEAFGYSFLGGVTSLLSFIVVIVVLIFRPQGLYGKYE